MSVLNYWKVWKHVMTLGLSEVFHYIQLMANIVPSVPGLCVCVCPRVVPVQVLLVIALLITTINGNVSWLYMYYCMFK